MGESLIVIVYCLLCCCTYIVEQTMIILIIIISTRLDLVDAAIFIPLHSAVCCRVRRSVKLIDEEWKAHGECGVAIKLIAKSSTSSVESWSIVLHYQMTSLWNVCIFYATAYLRSCHPPPPGVAEVHGKLRAFFFCFSLSLSISAFFVPCKYDTARLERNNSRWFHFPVINSLHGRWTGVVWFSESRKTLFFLPTVVPVLAW